MEQLLPSDALRRPLSCWTQAWSVPRPECTMHALHGRPYASLPALSWCSFRLSDRALTYSHLRMLGAYLPHKKPVHTSMCTCTARAHAYLIDTRGLMHYTLMHICAYVHTLPLRRIYAHTRTRTFAATPGPTSQVERRGGQLHVRDGAEPHGGPHAVGPNSPSCESRPLRSCLWRCRAVRSTRRAGVPCIR